MNTMTTDDRTIARLETHLLAQGYGEGAWHGPDLKAALTDVTPALAFRRPAEGRHNIAEIALHHAYCVRNVRATLTGVEAEPFVLDGDDWFALDDGGPLPWPKIAGVVAHEHERLARTVAELAEGRTTSPLTSDERFELVAGITCHAVYHAGQVQLIKRLVITPA